MNKPTKDEILAVLAEVEPLSSTLSRFPGLTRGELLSILRGRARTSRVEPPDEHPGGVVRASKPALRAATATEEPRSAMPLVNTLLEAPVLPPTPLAIPRQTKVILSTDGAARGNPGPASIGVVLAAPDGKILETISRRIGRTSNNIAEYAAVRAGLERARELGAHSVHLRCDSELAIRQLTGVYQVKNEALRPLFDEVKRLEAGFAGGVTFEHVRREYNRQADALANEALDTSS